MKRLLPFMPLVWALHGSELPPAPSLHPTPRSHHCPPALLLLPDLSWQAQLLTLIYYSLTSCARHMGSHCRGGVVPGGRHLAEAPCFKGWCSQAHPSAATRCCTPLLAPGSVILFLCTQLGMAFSRYVLLGHQALSCLTEKPVYGWWSDYKLFLITAEPSLFP